jgi:hypothetical protein
MMLAYLKTSGLCLFGPGLGLGLKGAGLGLVLVDPGLGLKGAGLGLGLEVCGLVNITAPNAVFFLYKSGTTNCFAPTSKTFQSGGRCE